jgi:hypothetical protein
MQSEKLSDFIGKKAAVRTENGFVISVFVLNEDGSVEKEFPTRNLNLRQIRGGIYKIETDNEGNETESEVKSNYDMSEGKYLIRNLNIIAAEGGTSAIISFASLGTINHFTIQSVKMVDFVGKKAEVRIENGYAISVSVTNEDGSVEKEFSAQELSVRTKFPLFNYTYVYDDETGDILYKGNIKSAYRNLKAGVKRYRIENYVLPKDGIITFAGKSLSKAVIQNAIKGEAFDKIGFIADENGNILQVFKAGGEKIYDSSEEEIKIERLDPEDESVINVINDANNVKDFGLYKAYNRTVSDTGILLFQGAEVRSRQHPELENYKGKKVNFYFKVDKYGKKIIKIEDLDGNIIYDAEQKKITVYDETSGEIISEYYLNTRAPDVIDAAIKSSKKLRFKSFNIYETSDKSAYIRVAVGAEVYQIRSKVLADGGFVGRKADVVVENGKISKVYVLKDDGSVEKEFFDEELRRPIVKGVKSQIYKISVDSEEKETLTPISQGDDLTRGGYLIKSFVRKKSSSSMIGVMIRGKMYAKISKKLADEGLVNKAVDVRVENGAIISVSLIKDDGSVEKEFSAQDLNLGGIFITGTNAQADENKYLEDLEDEDLEDLTPEEESPAGESAKGRRGAGESKSGMLQSSPLAGLGAVVAAAMANPAFYPMFTLAIFVFFIYAMLKAFENAFKTKDFSGVTGGFLGVVLGSLSATPGVDEYVPEFTTYVFGGGFLGYLFGRLMSAAPALRKIVGTKSGTMVEVNIIDVSADKMDAAKKMFGSQALFLSENRISFPVYFTDSSFFEANKASFTNTGLKAGDKSVYSGYIGGVLAVYAENAAGADLAELLSGGKLEEIIRDYVPASGNIKSDAIIIEMNSY